MRAGVILAGGRSTRFGEADKAVAELAGTPMIRRVADRLASVVDEVVVNGRSEQREAIEAALEGLAAPPTYAADPEPDQGPLFGIRTGLAAADADCAAVVACDMPFVEPALVEFLFDRVTDHDAAVPRIGDGWYQTTQAVYRTRPMIAACDAARDRGEGRIVAAFDDLDVREVSEAEVLEHGPLETFDNINTPEEFQDAVHRLSEAG
ncbi:MAG: molybdenum cofactor guanylyltransferase [Halobacteriales archaeon]